MSYQITPIICIKSISQLAPDALASTPGRLLLVSSPTVSGLAGVRQLETTLRKYTEVDVFNQIRPDAPLSHIEAIYKEYKKPDIIIAIGGGSVLDSAKALSVCWTGLEIRELFYKRADLPEANIPVLAVPTTAGTGAELSYGAILYDEALGIKGGIRGRSLQPVRVCIDVDLYRSAPDRLIAETGFDCLTHAIETYVSKMACPMVRYQSVAAVRTVLKHLQRAVEGSQDSLLQIAMASCLMGANLAFSTTCLPHRLQYVLGPLKGSSHAQGLIALYCGWLPEISKTDVFFDLASRLDMSVELLVDSIYALKKVLDIDYRASGLGLNSENISSLAKSASGTLDSDPCYRSQSTLITILENSL